MRLLLSSADFLSKLTFLKNLTGTLSVSNGLYADQNIRSVGTELGPNYLQMLSADKERVGNLGKNEYKVSKGAKIRSPYHTRPRIPMEI